MMVINETMGMSYITIVSQCDFQTNSMDKAIMSAASFIGEFLKHLSSVKKKTVPLGSQREILIKVRSSFL